MGWTREMEMRRSGKQAFDLLVAQPCTEDWTSMRATRGGRFCEMCSRDVVEVSALTEGQAELLAMRSAAGEKVCGRVTRYPSGELMLREPDVRNVVLRGAVMSAALAAGLPMAAQEFAREAPPVDLPLCGPPAKANDTVTGCYLPQPAATMTGKLRRPDGSAVESGMIRVSSGHGSTLYVADAVGAFELHEEPGTYDIVVQTGPGQAEQVRSVELHAGYQTFGDMRTADGQTALTDEVFTTLGEVSATMRWSWRARLRHPLLYARAVLRRN